MPRLTQFHFSNRQQLIATLNGLRSEMLLLIACTRGNANLHHHRVLHKETFDKFVHVLSNEFVIEICKFNEFYEDGGLKTEVDSWNDWRTEVVNVYLEIIQEHNWMPYRHHNRAHPHRDPKGRFVHYQEVKKAFGLPDFLGDLVLVGHCVIRIAERMARYFPEDNDHVTRIMEDFDRTLRGRPVVGRYPMFSGVDGALKQLDDQARQIEQEHDKGEDISRT